MVELAHADGGKKKGEGIDSPSSAYYRRYDYGRVYDAGSGTDKKLMHNSLIENWVLLND